MTDQTLGHQIEFDPDKILSIDEIIDMASLASLITPAQSEDLKSKYSSLPSDHWLHKRLNQSQTFYKVKDLRLFAILLYEHSYSVQDYSLTVGGAITHYLRDSRLWEYLRSLFSEVNNVGSMTEILWQERMKNSSSRELEALVRIFLAKYARGFDIGLYSFKTKEQLGRTLEPSLQYLKKVLPAVILSNEVLDAFVLSYDQIGSTLFKGTAIYKYESEEGFTEAVTLLVDVRLNPDFQIFYT